MQKYSLQIQSVLYKTDKNALYKSLKNIKNSIEISQQHDGVIGEFLVYYGDASDKPIFSEEEIKLIEKENEYFFTFRYLFFGFNSGSAKGHNILGEKCNADYIMTLNPDVITSPKLFINIMKPFLDSELNVGLVEGRQSPIEHPKYFDQKTGETSWAATACAIFPTDIFRQLNGFDDKSFFMYCDEVDFSWRIKLLGKKIIYQPLATVYHAKTLTNDAGWMPTKAELYYSAEARLMLLYKWSNEKLADKFCQQYLDSQVEYLIEIANNYLNKKKSNSMPEQVDNKHQVAEHLESNYIKFRFPM